MYFRKPKNFNNCKVNTLIQMCLKLVIGYNLVDNLKILSSKFHFNSVLFTYCLSIFSNNEDRNNFIAKSYHARFAYKLINYSLGQWSSTWGTCPPGVCKDILGVT
jgi:hypothetical protein